MTRAEILESVTRILVETFEIDATRVRPEADLAEDLGLDSIDAIDLAVKLEELTGLRVEEGQLKAVRTMQDVIELVEVHLRQAS